MQMKLNHLLILMVGFITAGCLIGCSKNENTSEPSIVGKWLMDNNSPNCYDYYTFNTDGTWKWQYINPMTEYDFIIDGTWSYNSNNKTLKISYFANPIEVKTLTETKLELLHKNHSTTISFTRQ